MPDALFFVLVLGIKSFNNVPEDYLKVFKFRKKNQRVPLINN